MHFSFRDPVTSAQFNLLVEETNLAWNTYQGDTPQLMAILWNRGATQRITIDHQQYDFTRNGLVALAANQSFELEHSSDIVAWQFNREFYCIVDHDQEVSCSGLLFYNSKDPGFVMLSDDEEKKFDLLYKVFVDEYGERDNLQAEMLRMLLKRLIVKITRLYKTQQSQQLPKDELDIIRQFNLLVDKNFRENHQVQDFARMMHKSPKTLSNVFSKYHDQSPRQIIQERILLEAKRLLIYTDQSLKEVAFATGFEEAAHFSRFFKKAMAVTPLDFRKKSKKSSFGKN